MRAYCWRTGLIEFGSRTPRGALPIATGPGKRLRAAISAAARHAYDPGKLLVPGIPEANSDAEALVAAKTFQGIIRKRISAA